MNTDKDCHFYFPDANRYYSAAELLAVIQNRLKTSRFALEESPSAVTFMRVLTTAIRYADRLFPKPVADVSTDKPATEQHVLDFVETVRQDGYAFPPSGNFKLTD